MWSKMSPLEKFSKPIIDFKIAVKKMGIDFAPLP